MKGFRLKNIKGFLDTGMLELKPITILIGENSSGKSSILRFPLVLRQTFLDASMAPLLFYGKSIDYGNFEDVVFYHDKTKSIEFEIAIDKNSLARTFPFNFGGVNGKRFLKRDFNVSVKIGYEENRLVIEKFMIYDCHTEEPMMIIERLEGNWEIRIGFLDDKKFVLSRNELGFEKFLPDFRLLKVRKNAGISYEYQDHLYMLFTALNYYFNNLVSMIYYIGPFRKTPDRFYRYTENQLDYVGRDGEFASAILGQCLRGNRSLVNNVSDWLGEELQFTLDVEDLKGDLFKIMVMDNKTGAKDNIIDVGHGLSQLLPIVVQTLMGNYEKDYRILNPRLPLNNLHIIEQPELHLHPAAQASLADLFVGAINKRQSKINNKFLIETHSEHMILRLRRYVVEKKVPPEKIAIYYSEKQKGIGSLNIRKLEIGEDGKIIGWPQGFFSQDYIEVLAIQDALRKKEEKRGSPLW